MNRRGSVGLIALPLLLSATVVYADGRAPRMLAYGRAANNPRFTNRTGNTWPAVANMTSVGAQPKWLVVANCPTRDELAIGTFDASFDVNLQFRRNGAFTAVTECTTAGGTAATQRAFDIAYEQTSGDMLVAYYSHGTTHAIQYRTCTGSTVSAAQSYSININQSVEFIKLIPKPGSNEIMMVAQIASSDAGITPELRVFRWNGTNLEGSVTVSTTTASATTEWWDLAYERLSNRPVLVYGSAANLVYRTHDGANWSAELPMGSTAANAHYVRLAPRPGTNEIVLATLNANKQISLASWNGASWSAFSATVPVTNYADRRCYDLAWEPDGSHALLVYNTTTTSLAYRTWDGAAWSAAGTGPNVNDQPEVIQLRPGNFDNEIFVLNSDAGDDLTASRWTGSAISSATQIEASLGGDNISEVFMLTPTPSMFSTPAFVPKLASWSEVDPR